MVFGGGAEQVHFNLGEREYGGEEGLNVMPAGVIAEVPGQPIVIVRIDALEGADIGGKAGYGEGHEDGGHVCRHFAEGAGKAVEKIFLEIGFCVDATEGDLFSELAEDGFSQERVEAGQQKLRMIVGRSQARGVRPGEQAVRGVGVNDATGGEPAAPGNFTAALDETGRRGRWMFGRHLDDSHG